jgi:hypothetical protein
MVALDPAAAPSVSRLLHPDQRTPLPPVELAQLTELMAQSLHNAFLLAGVLAVIAVALACYLPYRLSPVNQPAPS